MEKDTNTQPNITPSPNIISLIKKAEEIYSKKIKNIVEPSQNGKYIAIEVGSEEYFIGETREEAVAKAKKKYPNEIPLTRRIGELEKASRHMSRSIRNLRYDRIF